MFNIFNKFKKKKEISNLIKHAYAEFEALGWLKDGKYCDEMQALICTQVIELLEKFSEHGHSGSSAPYAINLFTKLASFKPIGPITGKDSEWSDDSLGSDDKTYQNKRCSAVFKDGKDGQAYYLDAIVFQGEEDYDTFTGTVEDIKSAQGVRFPFTPKTFYIDVIRVKKPWDPNEIHVSSEDGEWSYKIKDRSQLKEVFEYYDKIEVPKNTEDINND